MSADKSRPRWGLTLPDFTIAGRTLVVTITGWRLVTLLLSLAGVIWGIYYSVRVGSDGDSALLATGATILLPIIISLLLAPEQKSADHSDRALLAVRDLQELRRSQVTVLEDLNGISLDRMEFGDRYAILKAMEEIRREKDQVGRSIGDWSEVSPTAVNDALNKQAKDAALLAEMERAWTTSEDQT